MRLVLTIGYWKKAPTICNFLTQISKICKTRVLKWYVKIKYNIRHENKVNENISIFILWGINIYVKRIQNNEKVVLRCVKLTNPLSFFKLDFQKMDRHKGGKWLIYDTKYQKDNHEILLDRGGVCTRISKYGFPTEVFINCLAKKVKFGHSFN